MGRPEQKARLRPLRSLKPDHRRPGEPGDDHDRECRGRRLQGSPATSRGQLQEDHDRQNQTHLPRQRRRPQSRPNPKTTEPFPGAWPGGGQPDGRPAEQRVQGFALEARPGAGPGPVDGQRQAQGECGRPGVHRPEPPPGGERRPDGADDRRQVDGAVGRARQFAEDRQEDRVTGRKVSVPGLVRVVDRPIPDPFQQRLRQHGVARAVVSRRSVQVRLRERRRPRGQGDEQAVDPSPRHAPRHQSPPRRQIPHRLEQAERRADKGAATKAEPMPPLSSPPGWWLTSLLDLDPP